MIELRNDSLFVSFPEVHPMARMRITFEKAFRATRTGQEVSKLSTREKFPLKHIDDYAANIPDALLKRGGVILPMRHSEALAIHFMPHKAKAPNGSPYENGDGRSWYPFIVMVGCGLVNAVSGGNVKDKLSSDPQNYLFIDEPTTLYGMNDKSGTTRQFIAAPLGKGITVEEQLTGSAEYGGIQLIIYPLKKKTFEEYYAPVNQKSVFKQVESYKASIVQDKLDSNACIPRMSYAAGSVPCCDYDMSDGNFELREIPDRDTKLREDPSMGISYGERICSTFNEDFYAQEDWDRKHCSRCFAHLLNSEAWEAITGEKP